MAVTITPVLAGTDTYIATVAVTDSELTSGNIAHGLGATPLHVAVCLTTADIATSPPWAATTIDGANVVVTRDATGAAVASSFRVTIKRPHSMGK